MNEQVIARLLSALDEWESCYIEDRRRLRPADMYIVWLRLFRLSRQVSNDYHTLLRSGMPADEMDAYTGDTQRLVH